MEFFRNILVGVDLSRAEEPSAEHLNEPTKRAIERAMWLAGQTSAELTFFSATELPPASEHLLKGKVLEILNEGARRVLDQLVGQAESEGIAARSQLVHGTAWEEIIRHVRQQGNDLVVAGTRDPGLASRFLFGNTAMRLLRHCPCPVWITKPGGDWNDLKILVASDLSEVSQEALDLGVRAARMTEAKLRVLHALEHQTGNRLRHAGLRDEDIRAYYETLRSEAEATLNEQLAQTDYRTVPAGVIAEVKDGPPETAILEAIDQHEIDLLIMGAVGRRGLAGMLIGNTAESLLPHVPCSILAVKPRDFESPVE